MEAIAKEIAEFNPDRFWSQDVESSAQHVFEKKRRIWTEEGKGKWMGGQC